MKGSLTLSETSSGVAEALTGINKSPNHKEKTFDAIMGGGT
jgi:hypothetical protein